MTDQDFKLTFILSQLHLVGEMLVYGKNDYLKKNLTASKKNHTEPQEDKRF